MWPNWNKALACHASDFAGSSPVIPVMKYFRGRKINYSHHYPRVWWPEHELAHECGNVFVHRVVAHEMFGGIPEGYEVHHIDENKNNFDPRNLQLLRAEDHRRIHNAPKEYKEKVCPICDSSFLVSKKNRRESKYVYCSPKCNSKSQEVIDWPEVEALIRLVNETSYSEAGRRLGVSDNAIRKRIKNHGS